MKRLNLILASAIAGTFCISAAVISPEAALQRALNDNSAPMKAPSAASSPKLLYTSMSLDNTPVCYVFGNSTGNGYMVLGADDISAPILGYSDNGVFDSSNIPENMKYWLGQYAAELDWARRAGIPAYQAPQSRTVRAPIAPLVKTLWDQGAPYYNDCPTVGSRHCATGCVATAMAQALNYHKYPEKGQGSISYYCGSISKQIVEDLSTFTFDWANMANQYSSSSPQTQIDAVAKLMYACGISVDMNYGTSASSSSTRIVPTAFIEHFNYSKSCYFLDRNYTPINQWIDALYNEIKTVGPVVYGGSTAGASSSGHCFICDGYDGNGYFHINWGWGGMSDGYFRVTALDPTSQGIGGATAGFNVDQEIVINMKRPGANDDYVLTMLCGSNFTISDKSVSLGNQIDITSTGGDTNIFYNISPVAVNGTIGIYIISSNGQKRYVYGAYLEDLQTNQGIRNYKVKLPTDLADGTYTVVPAWKSKDYTERNVLPRIGCRGSYKMVVANKTATFTAEDVNPFVKVNKADLLTPLYQGMRAKFNLTISNNSGAEYYGQLNAGLFTAGSADGSRPNYTGTSVFIDVENNSTETFEYTTSFASTSSAAPAGDYVMYFYQPNTFKRMSDPINITIQTPPANSTLEITDFRLKNNASVLNDKYNVIFEFDAKCTEGVIDKTLTIGISQKGANYWRSNFTTPEITLFKGESESVAAFGVCSALQNNKTYIAYLYDGKTSSAPKLAGPIEFLYTEDAGISGVDNDNEVVATELYSLLGVKIPADTKVPGHYVRVRHYADGTTVTDHYIIK